MSFSKETITITIFEEKKNKRTLLKYTKSIYIRSNKYYAQFLQIKEEEEEEKYLLKIPYPRILVSKVFLHKTTFFQKERRIIANIIHNTYI